MIGSFQLRNNDSTDCWLDGRPAVAILDGSGHPLAINVVPPKHVRAVRLRAHEAADVQFQWHNWCRLEPTPAAMRLELPAHGGTITTKADIGRPRCDDANATSTLTLSAFERAT